jgi:hypothetical protein
MRVYIPSDFWKERDRRGLFILVRPFLGQTGWNNSYDALVKWNLQDIGIHCTDSLPDAGMMLLPYTINDYLKWGEYNRLVQYNNWCIENNIKGYGFVSGDWGESFPEFSNLIYFRLSGFRKQLSSRNQGFPVSLSDHYIRLYRSDIVSIRQYSENPVIGFCGHATLSFSKRIKESLKFFKENTRRLIKRPFRSDLEPIFPSAYYRAKIMRNLEHTGSLTTNFIYRSNYRAGAKTETQLKETTKAYYDNILNSDYVLCIRGGGNFSVRLYETLMMGRIPVFVNTDCLLPFPEEINWKIHAVWVEWSERKFIADKILKFHKQQTATSFMQLQKANRDLWLNQLSVAGIYRLLLSRAKKTA